MVLKSGMIHPLKAFRSAQNPPISQQELAELLGVGRINVTRWESGDRKIPDDLLPVVVEKTGIDVVTLRPDLAPLQPLFKQAEAAE